MTAAKPRLILAALIAVVLAALVTVALLPGDAPAATNPRIIGVSLVAGHEFTAGTVVVYNASGVAVCVSGKCKRALKSQPGVWNITPSGLPKLVRGQSRQVIVFAVSSSGAYAYYKKQVTVK
jgi:hypothetical protein